MKRHGVASLAGKMAAQMRRGKRINVARPYADPEEGEEGETPAAPAAPAMPLWGFLFYDWNTINPNDFSTTGILCSRFIKGYNYTTVWEPFLQAKCAARGAPWSPGVAVGSPDLTEVRYYTDFSGSTRTVAGNYVQLFGRIALEVAAAMDVAVFGHAPPAEHLAYVKSISHVGTKCLTGLHNFASVNQRTDTYDRENVLRLIGRGYPVTGKPGTGWGGIDVNQYGCTTIDWYENTGSGLSDANWAAHVGTPSYAAGLVSCPHTSVHAGLPANATVAPNSHTMECDVTNATYQQAIVDGFSDFVDLYTATGTSVLDGLLVDNLLNNKFTSSAASLAYPDAYTDAVYVAGWKAMCANWRADVNGSSKYPNIDYVRWANTSDLTTNYSSSDMKNRWVEFFFVSTDGSAARAFAGANGIQEAIQRAKSVGLRIVLGMTGTFRSQNVWATTDGGPTPATNGTWADIVTEITTQDAWDNCYAQVLRMTNGGYGFWQTGFRALS